MTLKDRLISLIRTFVPQVVAVALAWIATNWGWVIPAEWAQELQLLAIEAVAAVYYSIVRWAEGRWPQVGWLLGWAAQPTYVPAPEVPKVEATGIVIVDGEDGHGDSGHILWYALALIVLLVILRAFGLI